MATSRKRKKKNGRVKGLYPDTGKAISTWRGATCNPETGKPYSRERLAALVGRCISTIVRWELGDAEPLVRDVRAMEAVQPGIVRALFRR